MSTDDLVAEALRLPRRERARVAEGRVQTVAWETARLGILKDLEEWRASRMNQRPG